MVVQKRDQQVGTTSDPSQGNDANGFFFLGRDRCPLGKNSIFGTHPKGGPWTLDIKMGTVSPFIDKDTHTCSVSIG